MAGCPCFWPIADALGGIPGIANIVTSYLHCSKKRFLERRRGWANEIDSYLVCSLDEQKDDNKYIEKIYRFERLKCGYVIVRARSKFFNGDVYYVKTEFTVSNGIDKREFTLRDKDYFFRVPTTNDRTINWLSKKMDVIRQALIDPSTEDWADLLESLVYRLEVKVWHDCIRVGIWDDYHKCESEETEEDD